MSVTLLEEVKRRSQQQIELCYHCHTCTAGCPASPDMQFGPDRIIRLIELGEKERVLTSQDVWLCASCETCTARCPNAIDVAQVMDTLRHISLAAGIYAPDRRIWRFHRLYLAVIRWLGRAHEASILGLHKVLNFDLTSDLDTAVRLIVRGKIPLIPGRLKGAADVRRIFEAAASAAQGDA